MKEKLQNMKEDTKKLLCIIGGITVALGAVFAIVKLCPKKEQKNGKKKK